MAIKSRVGTSLLLIGGVAIAAVMAFSLTLDGRRPGSSRKSTASEVAVLFPDRNGWLDFRRGADLCARRGQVLVVSEEPGAVTVVAPREKRELRFVWYRARGSVETREVVHRLMDRPDPPLAIVGSSNTALTADLAETLQSTAKHGGAGPLLLVPWATAVETVTHAGGTKPISLLDLYPGRMFRFSANNQRAADLVVACLAKAEPESRPARVIMAVDPDDPYSTDLARCFRAAITRLAPDTAIAEHAEAVKSSGVEIEPSREELRWAEDVWKQARENGSAKPTWVVLPLQAEPTRRLLVALTGYARAHRNGNAPIRVLCGDGIGIDVLSEFAHVPGLSVWIMSSGCGPHLGVGLAHDEHIPAEIITALTLALDESENPEELRSAMRRLNLDAKHPAALCRSLAFEPSGERRADDVGHVLAVGPDGTDVMTYAPSPDGTWNGPIAVSPPQVVSLP
jgi:hypothetical protein